jgi:hypothetical protein
VDDEDRVRSSAAERLAVIRAELRFELSLLHERVNTLVTAQAFLTISYTAAMSNSASWGPVFSAVVSPILSVLGLLLALLAWPGVASTVRLVLDWTADQAELLEYDSVLSPGLSVLPSRVVDRRRVTSGQWRSLLLFRAVPGLFVVVWTVLTIVALLLPR